MKQGLEAATHAKTVEKIQEHLQTHPEKVAQIHKLLALGPHSRM